MDSADSGSARIGTRRLMLAVRLLARVCLISAASSSSTHRPLLQLRRMRTPQQSLVSRTPATEVLVSRTVNGVDPECVQRVLNATKTKLPSWEQCRSGDDCELPLDPPRAPPILPYRALHRAEYGLLRGIQRTPGLLSPSLAVHYSLLPKVITPLLAIIVWFSSLPLGASLITFVCAADLVNTALKWAVQRPRPRWYSPSHESGLEVKAGNIAWEVDLSFPSAHTQFFAGLAFCAAALNGWSAVLPAAFGAFIGLTRNYLSMHWPSDTIAALGVGAVLGTFWGRVDPWRRLLEAGSPLLSLTAATAFTSGLLCLMVAVRQAVPPVQADIKTYWYANALAALPERARAETRSSAQRQLKPRNLKSKIPMLVTVWTTLAITGFYPMLLPTAAAEPSGPLLSRLLQVGVGLGGLGGIMLLKDWVKEILARRQLATDRMRGALKGLTYLAICLWCFLLSQRTHGALLAMGAHLLK